MFPDSLCTYFRQDGHSVQEKLRIHITSTEMSWGKDTLVRLDRRQARPQTKGYEIMKQVLWFMDESTWYCQPTSLSQLSIPPTPRTAAAIVR